MGMTDEFGVTTGLGRWADSPQPLTQERLNSHQREPAALVRQMREALAARRAFDTEPGCAINRKLYGAMDYAIAAADEWLSRQRGPLTDEQISEIEGWFSNEFGLEAKHSTDFARTIETECAAAWGVKLEG